MSITIQKIQSGWQLSLQNEAAAYISTPAGCTDSFEPLGDGAFRWHRKCDKPVTQMKLTLKTVYQPRYFQVPSVNYNGNGWGSGAQYSGFGCDGTPWTYAWHRVAVPACTYSEQGPWGVSLFGEE